MATVFGASLSPMEREAQLLFMECEMNSSKIEALQDITNAQYERALTEAEYIVLKTGGTYDDLDRLMMEAAVQQGEKKVGIIRTILNSIGSTISKLGEWIQRNLGANNERLTGVPAGTTVNTNAYDLKAANDGLTGLPKVFNRLKEIIAGIKACMSEHKEFTIASLAVGAVAAVLVRGSKEEQEAKEAPITEVTKETAQDMFNKLMKLQGTANELTGECNSLLDKLTLPIKAGKAKAEDIAGKKNAKREAKENAAAGDNGGQQQAAPAGEEAKTESAEEYGLGAYDGLFMESKKRTKKNQGKTNAQVNNETKTGTGSTSSAGSAGGTGTASGQSGQTSTTGSTSRQSSKPGNQQASGTGSTGSAGTANGQSGQTSTTGSTSGQSGQSGQTKGQPQTSGQPKDGETKEEPPKTEGQPKDGGSAPDTNAQGNAGNNAQTEEKPESEFSKLPWYEKAATVLQATLSTMGTMLAITGKAVLNIVAKVMQWDKIKAKAGDLEQRVMDGKGNGKNTEDQQSNEGNDQQQEADNGGEANADNGQESAVDNTITGDYTTEAPDLFGIRDEYNEMMESPSIEELNSFEAIFDNL